MRKGSLVALALVFVSASSSLLGCASCRKDGEASSDAGEGAEPAASATAEARADGDGAGRRPGRARPAIGGALGLFVSMPSVQSLAADKQVRVDDLVKSVVDAHDTRNRAEAALRAYVLSAVEGGSTDAAMLETLRTAVENGTNAAHEAEASALNALHAALDPAERKALAAEVRTRVSTRRDNMRGRGRDGGARSAPTGDDRAKKRAEHLESELGVDPAQKKKLAALSAQATRKERADDAWSQQLALADAFEKDTFDAKQVAGGGFTARPELPTVIEDSRFYTELASVLRPDQRAKLAEVMKGRGPRRGGRGEGGGRGRGHDGHDHGRGHGPPGGMPGMPPMPDIDDD